MTAEEIRKQSDGLLEYVCTKNSRLFFELWPQYEIAAQLAELNETLKNKVAATPSAP